MLLDDLYDVPRLTERFWAAVDKTDTCWLWTRARHEQGYGLLKVRIKGKYYKVRAHRIAYILTYGFLANTALVLHTCDTPACVNPDHLIDGTAAENMRDMSRKGRHKGGQRAGGANSRALLDEGLVAEIRTRYKAGGCSLNQLAAEYGVSRGAIHDAVDGRNWRSVPGLSVSELPS